MRSALNPIFHRIAIFSGGLIVSAALVSCGAGSGRQDTSDIAEAFFESQKPGSGPIPSNLFADEAAAEDAARIIARREMEFGSLVSYKRIASNKKVSVEAQGRVSTATYIFEITCENGRTREMLTISKTGGSDPFRITEYVIEDMQTEQESLPSGTSTA